MAPDRHARLSDLAVAGDVERKGDVVEEAALGGADALEAEKGHLRQLPGDVIDEQVQGEAPPGLGQSSSGAVPAGSDLPPLLRGASFFTAAAPRSS